MSQHLSGKSLKAALCSTFETLRVSVPSMLSVVEGAQNMEGLSRVRLRSWNMMGHVPSGPCGFSFRLREMLQGGMTDAYILSHPKTLNASYFSHVPVDSAGISM